MAANSISHVPDRRAIRAFLVAAVALAVGLAWSAAANAFPVKPITLIVPFPPGGAADALVRTLGNAASADLGQPVIIMHKPGGGAVTGTASLTQNTAADGHTLALMHNSVIRHPLLQKVSWDPLVDFTYVIGLVNLSTLVVVRAEAPWKSIQELLADAKARPGIISYGNVGAASANRIAGEQLARAAGGEFNMVPFKGGAEAMTSLMGGHLDVYGDPGVGPVALSGKIRVLATFTDQRLKRFPNVPTLKETGYPLAVYSPLGLVGPKGMDPAVVARLQNAFRKATSDPAYQKVLEDYDLQPYLMSSDEYRKYAGEQFARDKALLPQLGFKPD
ncbi:tripartite tricarboxylate transporter substrate binding protein [Rhodoferax sp.]|uniref:tripartite tricarboxylate transporter substrate binding protein n=1 Tax=Rhodoferax sp. TaxID=50421 RepID=UPI001ED23AE7|nr:tripartite tricarboxylate transporter substrate binding protein [Rhodoferax sp.]MBT9507053.1 tripartite tricarboxylate transporter substrate binding protein [Rhodoferax sp.]